MHGSQNVLRARVKDIPGETVKVSSAKMTRVVAKPDELSEIDPADQRHLCYEEMKRLLYAMREIESEDSDDETLARFMTAADEMSNVIYSIELKRRHRTRTQHKFIL